MTEKAPPPILPIDPAVLKAVEELRAYAAEHPEARGAALAIDAIVERFIAEVLSPTDGPPDAGSTIKSLQAVAAAFPESPIPPLHLSKVCVDSGDFEAGLRFADAGLAIAPGHAGLLFNRSRCLQEAKRHEEAIAGFKQCLELEPENLWAYNNIGDAYRSLRLYDQAEAYLKLAIRKNERFSPAYYNLAMVYMDQGDWPNCLRYARIAERRDPTNTNLQLALGDAYMGLKDPGAALYHLLLASGLDRGFVEAYETMAAAYADLGMHELSRGAAREALQRNPKSWKATASLGLCAFSQGDRDEGLRLLLDALASGPDPDGEFKLCWELGWKYLQTGDYRQAMTYTDRAIRLKEYPDVELSFNRGLILLAQDDLPGATEIYEQAFARARATRRLDAAFQAAREAGEFLATKGRHLDPASALYALFQRNTGLPG